MKSPIIEMYFEGAFANEERLRFTRAGVAVTGTPPEVSKAVPPDSYAGYTAINTDTKVDCIVGRRDKTNFKLKFETD